MIPTCQFFEFNSSCEKTWDDLYFSSSSLLRGFDMHNIYIIQVMLFGKTSNGLRFQIPGILLGMLEMISAFQIQFKSSFVRNWSRPYAGGHQNSGLLDVGWPTFDRWVPRFFGHFGDGRSTDLHIFSMFLMEVKLRGFLVLSNEGLERSLVVQVGSVPFHHAAVACQQGLEMGRW